jgi:hypothetical protein
MRRNEETKRRKGKEHHGDAGERVHVEGEKTKEIKTARINRNHHKNSRPLNAT